MHGAVGYDEKERQSISTGSPTQAPALSMTLTDAGRSSLLQIFTPDRDFRIYRLPGRRSFVIVP